MSDWITVYKSVMLNNAEIVKAVLSDHQIDAVIVNKMDSMLKGLLGDIEVHVNNKDVINAKHLISKHKL